MITQDKHPAQNLDVIIGQPLDGNIETKPHHHQHIARALLLLRQKAQSAQSATTQTNKPSRPRLLANKPQKKKTESKETNAMASDLATRSSWRQELAARDAAASRSSTRPTDSASSSPPPPPPPSSKGFTSRHDPQNGKKHKRAAKKAGKKAEARERELVNRDRHAVGLGDVVTKREEWVALEKVERRWVGKEKSVEGRRGRDCWREEWLMHGDGEGEGGGGW